MSRIARLLAWLRAPKPFRPTRPCRCGGGYYAVTKDGAMTCKWCGGTYEPEVAADEAEPGVVYWEGQVSCDGCGYGTSGSARAVVPISEHMTDPPPLECPCCRNMTLKPLGQGAEPEGAEESHDA